MVSLANTTIDFFELNFFIFLVVYLFKYIYL